VASLSEDDRETLARARSFYDAILQASAEDLVGPVDMLSRPISRDLRRPVDRELRRLDLDIHFPRNRTRIEGKVYEYPPSIFDEYQQTAVERQYEGLGEMIEQPGYRALKEPEQKKLLTEYSRDLSEEVGRQLRERTILEGGRSRRSLLKEARRGVRNIRDRERALDENIYLRNFRQKQREALR
jgi:hypothetical protein